MNSRSFSWLAFALFASASTAGVAAPKPAAKPVAKPKPAAKPTVKPVAKPTPKPVLIREVMGTTELVGYEGKVGQTFTLGKDMPFNFTLRSAEFTASRVNVGAYAHYPKGDEKMLVVRFTIHNPTKKVLTFNTHYLKFTAVDSGGVSRNYVADVAREVTGESLQIPLNPGQKIDAYTAIRVAAYGPVPKLIVQHAYETKAPIVRYDLRNVAKKLVAPYADAKDASGTTLLKTVAAQNGVFYPVTETYDMKLESVAYVDGPVNGRQPNTGYRYCVATFTIKNSAPAGRSYSQSEFRAELKDADGEKTNYNTSMLKGSRDEEAYGRIEPGEEIRVRFYWQIPQNVAAQTILMRYGYDSDARTFAFVVPE